MAAERSYPTSEASGGRKETPHVRGQWRLGGATLSPRPGAGSWKEPTTPKARASSREEQRKERWLHKAQEALEELSHVEGQEQR